MRAAVGAMLLLAWTLEVTAAERPVQSDIVAQISARLVHSPILRASFHQERTMQVLSRPLVTRGRVTAVAGRGVLWQASEPYEVAVLMTGDEIVEWDGDVPRRINLAGIPVFRALAGVLLRALNGDTSEITRLFELTPVVSDRGWRLALTPKDQGLAKAIFELEIAGSRFVEEVVIREAGGDATRIRFGDFRTEPEVLDAAEKVYFAQ